ncbi:MAG: hypothetical protein C0508_29665 [Cyanobacteria bacterium PR.023]|nr:hypothetical protein [Cyanobacteria bacterium PR.023]MDZ4385698.1 hypothetical protein [Moraxellaceae bacterium]
MKYKAVIQELREALNIYSRAIDAKPSEEKEDFLRVVWHAEQVAIALEVEDIEKARLSFYAFSRQVSDSFYAQPPEFRVLGQKMKAAERAIV